MSNKEVHELSEKLKHGLELAEKRMLHEKALRGECVVVCDKDKALQLIQVAYEIDTPKSFNRETAALIQAAAPLHCDHLTIVAFTPTRDVQIDGKTIHIVSAIDWLLS